MADSELITVMYYDGGTWYLVDSDADNVRHDVSEMLWVSGYNVAVQYKGYWYLCSMPDQVNGEYGVYTRELITDLLQIRVFDETLTRAIRPERTNPGRC